MKFDEIVNKILYESIIVSNPLSIVDTEGDYTIVSQGIDDPGSEKHYSNLEDVARFLKSRDQGPEYRKTWGLQDEYTRYAFRGFTWSDILDGNPTSSEATYKPQLVNLPLKLRWKHEKIDRYGVYTDAWYGYEGSDTGYDIAAAIYLDKQGKYHPQGGWNLAIYSNQIFNNLEDAKKQAYELTKEYKKKYG